MSDHSQPSQEVKHEQRVSVVVGDRLCIECGYNLTGQPVVREPHYDMLIIRCPECSTVASTQEYPLLGRWAGRWAALVAALWFLIILGAWLACAGVIFGMSVGTSELAAQGFIESINAAFQVEASGALPSAGGLPPNTRGGTNFTSFQQWWQTVDPNRIAAGAGGWVNVIEWSAFYMWIPLATVAVVFGCFWSIAMLTLRRWRVIVWCLLVAMLAGVFAALTIAEWQSSILHSAGMAARETLGPPALIASIIVATLAMIVGALLGRSIIRTMVRALLPPRLCSSLALLWTVDNLDPPTPGVWRSRR